MMLIHWPMQDDLGTYRALEEAYQAGKLRSIGVSNFNRAQLGEIMANFQTVPVLKDLAAKYDHTTAQVMLRYLTQRQIMVIPRSTNPAHMAANINIFDFALTAADLARVQALDEKFSLSGLAVQHDLGRRLLMCYNWINDVRSSGSQLRRNFIMSDNGKVDKIKGTVKETAGDVTDDKKLKAKGILDKTVGKVKEAAEDVKDTAEGVAKDIKEKFDK